MSASDSGPFAAMMACTFSPISRYAVSQSMGSNSPLSVRRSGCVTRSSLYAIWANPCPRAHSLPLEYGCCSMPFSVNSEPPSVVAMRPHLLEQPLHSDGVTARSPPAAWARSVRHAPNESDPTAASVPAAAADPFRNVLRET